MAVCVSVWDKTIEGLEFPACEIPISRIELFGRYATKRRRKIRTSKSKREKTMRTEGEGKLPQARFIRYGLGFRILINWKRY